MPSQCRNPLAVVVCLFIAATTFAQQTITASIAGDKVRFTSQSATSQLRVEITAADGTILFDSSWKDGNIVDWPVQPLADGSYGCLITSKDLEGKAGQRSATLLVRDGKVSIENGAEHEPKVTLLAHDGSSGAIVTTAGDLSFRFGDFFAGKDSERMRLTADGLDVDGYIRATKGIRFADGTILTTGNDTVLRRMASSPMPETRAMPRLPILPLAPGATKLRKQANFTPAYQFVVGANGVNVGTTDPTYALEVTGTIDTASSYEIGGFEILSANTQTGSVGLGLPPLNPAMTGSLNTFVGSNAGYGDSTGYFNAAFGADSGSMLSSGIDNSFFGYSSGENLGASSGVSTGSGNSFFGFEAGASATAESFNTAIGASSDVTPGVTNSTALGAYARTAQSNTVILGSIAGVNSATATASTGIATQTPNQYLGVGGGITIDENNANSGGMFTNSVLAFGTNASNGLSGEGIASQRTAAGGNQFGLDFYTNYTKRMSIANDGTVTVYGGLVKPAGSFKIDDPIDPKNKSLSHSFVESPDMMNIYNGNVVLDENGEAVVRLPDWFEALNQDFRYQLTCMHGWAPVYVDEEIANNQFKIAGGKPGMKVSWQVTGIRHDPYANAHRIPVEEEKGPAERGKYLYPSAYGESNPQ